MEIRINSPCLIALLFLAIFNFAQSLDKPSDNSAYLAHIRQLRQNGPPPILGNERRSSRPSRMAPAKKAKTKRYKCYLVDDEEEQGPPIGQKSYFAGFQRGNEPNGMEGQNNRNGVRKSEGRAPSSSSATSFSARTAKAAATTREPMIEYIDYDVGETNRPSSTTLTPRTAATLLQPQKSKQQPMIRSKIRRRPLSSAATADESKSSSANDAEEWVGREELEDLYSDDLYITTTSPRPVQKVNDQKLFSSSRQNSQQPSKFGHQVSGPPKAIPHGIVESAESEEEVHGKPAQARLPVHAIVPQASMASKTRIWPQSQFNGQLEQQNHQQQQPQQQLQQQQQEMARGPPPRDTQGRPLILSPDHCKMINSYAQMYGLRAPSAVVGFVHNNCAFAKMYLPSASCAEIDLLVQSCYQKSLKL